jgi:hypothetical protein
MAEVKNICLEALERHCSRKQTGRLDFGREGYEGQIFIQDGFMVHAHLTGMEGVPALFRLFDWGDAETTWNSGVVPKQASLHLPMAEASVLYAGYLQEKADLEAQGKEQLDNAFTTPEMIAAQAGGMESVLKYYLISLECSTPAVLPGGFSFVDATRSSYVIGRSEECDVVLQHPSVDPLHCGVMLEKGALFIWDLGAQSGVKLNGVPVAEDILKVGDVMTLGSVELRVRFNLRRPTLNKPITMPLPTIPAPGKGLSPKEMLSGGAITFDRTSRQIKVTGKNKPFLSKWTSMFGGKKGK